MKQSKPICESGWKQRIIEGRFSIDSFTMAISGIFFIFIMQFFVDNPSHASFDFHLFYSFYITYHFCFLKGFAVWQSLLKIG
ncbi:MAG: hypothetical protein R3Y18_00470 [Bacillota bacterium]